MNRGEELGLVDAMRCNSGETVSLMFSERPLVPGVLTRSTVMYCSDTRILGAELGN